MKKVCEPVADEKYKARCSQAQKKATTILAHQRVIFSKNAKSSKPHAKEKPPFANANLHITDYI